MIQVIERNLINENIEEASRFVARKLNKRVYKKFIANLFNSLKFEENKKVEALELEPVLIENECGVKVIAAVHIKTTEGDANLKDIYIPILNNTELSIPLNYIINAGIKYASLRDISKALKEFGYNKVKYTYRDQIIEF